LKHDEYESERKRKRGQVCMITVDGVTVCIDPSLPLFNEMGRKYSMIIVAILRQKEEGIKFQPDYKFHSIFQHYNNFQKT
jgi:hypothetical protein